jgi:DNA polymerase III subunit delta'
MANPKKDKVIAPQPSPALEAGPRFFREILGQERVLAHLKTAMAKGRLSHAYLFLGPEGVGKESTARALAAALNCTAPREDADACGACPSCRRLAAGTHPDLVVVVPSSEGHQPQIKIERIRELRRLTEYPPLGGGWRVVIIKPAEALTAQNDAAANALLKTLEEPPDRHLLVLTATMEADLLPTVVSRCHKLAFTPLPLPLVTRELVARRKLSQTHAALLAALSGGSLGRALKLDPEELLSQRRQVLSDLAQLVGGPDAAVLDWAQRLAKNRAELDYFLLMAQLWYRDLLLAHYQAPAHLLAHLDLQPEIDAARGQGTPETWLARFSALGAAGRHLQANLNPELTLDILGLRLKRQGYLHDAR